MSAAEKEQVEELETLEMTDEQADFIDSLEADQKVLFLGYSQEPGDNDLNIEIGDVGVFKEVLVNEKGEEIGSYIVEFENPDFDSSKRESKKNPKVLPQELWFDEFGPLNEDAEQEADAQEEEQEQEPVQEEAPATKKKGRAKKATDTSTNKKAKQKTEAKANKKAVAKAEPKALVETDEEHSAEDILIEVLKKQDPEIQAIVDGNGDLLGYTHDLLKKQLDSNYRISAMLYNIALTGQYRIEEEYSGKGGFAKFVEKEFGVTYRTARYWINNYITCCKFNIDREKLDKIGWTKFNTISQIALDEENKLTKAKINKLMNEAESLSVKDFQESVKVTYKQSKVGEATKFVKYTFAAPGEESGILDDAMADAMGYYGIEEDSKMALSDAFRNIVKDWHDQIYKG